MCAFHHTRGVYHTIPSEFGTYKQESKSWDTREAALVLGFQHLNARRCDLQELIHRIQLENPQLEAQHLLEISDDDANDEVSEQEFVAALDTITKSLDDAKFARLVDDILYRPKLLQAGYQHPEGNHHEFLEKQLLPVLRRGLEALVIQTEEERIKVASWQEFPDGLLPDVWSPFCPLQWLAEYLHRHNPTLRYAAPVTPKQWSQLSREEKVEMCFTHLDRDGNGYLTVTELLALTTKNNFQSDIAEAQINMQWLDADGDDQVSKQEFCEAMDFFLSGLDEEDFDETVYNIMSSSHLSFFSRQEKLQMAFRKLDASMDDVLDLEEMMAFGRTFGTGVDVRKAKMTILWMDQDGDRKVNMEEFLRAMAELTNHLPDDKFDTGIHKMLTATLPLSDAIDPVERLPRKLRALVEEMPTHSLARQMSVREAMRHYVEAGDAGQAPVIFVDVRTLEETTVSTIPNAVQLNVHVKMNDLDLLATDMSFLASHFVPGTAADSNAAPLAKGPAKAAPKAAPAAKGKKEAAPVGPGKTTIPPAAVVICYDSMGLRGGLAAIELEKFLNNGTAVYNLCGGIIQWYNEEGEVQHPVEKHAVQSVHPHQRLNTGFVKRHNEFKTDDLVKEQAEKDVKKRRKSRFSSTASVSSNNTRGGPKPAVAE